MVSAIIMHVWRCSKHTSLSVFKTGGIKPGPFVDSCDSMQLIVWHPRGDGGAVALSRSHDMTLKGHQTFEATASKFSKCEKLLLSQLVSISIDSIYKAHGLRRECRGYGNGVSD